MEKLKTSEYIANFLNFYTQSLREYEYYYDMVNKCEKLECDIKHKIEMGTYRNRNEQQRLYTQLKLCLKDRRYYKNKVEELEPFVSLFKNLNDSHNVSTNDQKFFTKFIDILRNRLGETRKVENYHQSRTYKPRILKDDLINNVKREDDII